MYNNPTVLEMLHFQINFFQKRFVETKSDAEKSYIRKRLFYLKKQQENETIKNTMVHNYIRSNVPTNLFSRICFFLKIKRKRVQQN